MKDLYKGFKKIAEDERSAKLQHENGHELTIAKSGLNKSMKKMLENLPLHQAEGTEPVIDPTEALQQPDQQLQTQSIGQQIAEDLKNELRVGAANATSVSTGEPVQKLAGTTQPDPEIMSGGGSRVITPSTTPSPVDIALQGFMPGQGGMSYDQLKNAAQQKIDLAAKQRAEEALKAEQAKQKPAQLAETAPATLAPTERKVSAEATPSRQEQMDAAMASLQTPSEQALTPGGVPETAPAVAKQPVMTDEAILESPTANLVDKQQAVTRIYQKTLKDLTQKAEDERQKIKEIDPNRLWNNLSTWGKIRNTIGLILGGIGGGLTHQENPAARALDRMIEQDVEAQKQDNTNRTNLYKFHLDRLKDSQAAYEATMKNLKDVVMNQIEIDRGLVPGGPNYGRNLELYYLKLQNERNEELQKRAAYRTRQLWSSAEAKGKTLAEQDPAVIANQIITDKDQRESVQKEIGRRKQIKQNAPLIMQKLDQVLSDYSGLGGIVKTPDSVKDLEIMIRGLVPDVAGDKDGTAKEATVQQFVKLLKPEGKFDVMFSDPQSFKNRAILWLTQNLSGSPIAGGMTLNDFDQTRIDPNMWDTVAVYTGDQLRYISKDKIPAYQQRAQQLGQTFRVVK